MILLTRHAIERMRERHPDYTEQQCRAMAELAVKCGQLSPGYNGCRRYRYLRKEFVVGERDGKQVVVTVV